MLSALDIGKRRGHQKGLIDRTAHRRDAACLVHRRANDGKNLAARGCRHFHRKLPQHANPSVEKDKRWVTLAFTWNGLRALGVDEGSLATFPEEFKQGMVARAEMLGDTGENHPDNWVGGLARPDLHAIAILFARDAAERGRCQMEHDKLVAQCQGVEVLSTLDLEATPPFDYAHDHFGYRDRLSQPVIEGTGEVPTPGTGAPLKPGEFILGYPDEDGPPANLPQPEILSRNGSYMAYRRLTQRLHDSSDSETCAHCQHARNDKAHLSLILLVLLITAANIDKVLQVFGTFGIFAGLLFIVLGVGIGWLLGGPDVDTKRVMALGTGQRNIAAALVVASQSFSDPKVIVMVIVVAIVGLIILMPLSRALANY